MSKKKDYQKPVLKKHEQLREVTLANNAPQASCSGVCVVQPSGIG